MADVLDTSKSASRQRLKRQHLMIYTYNRAVRFIRIWNETANIADAWPRGNSRR